MTDGKSVRADGPWTIAMAFPDTRLSGNKGVARMRANARLIAAAPDLAEVGEDAADLLQHYVEFIRSVKADDLERHPYLPSVDDAVRGLRAALSKARGETGGGK